jgi:ribosomal protein L15
MTVVFQRNIFQNDIFQGGVRPAVGRIRKVHLTRPKKFSRKYWEELVAAEAAARRAEERVLQLRSEEKKAALESAAQAAKEAIEAADRAEIEVEEVAQLAAALNAATKARKTADTIVLSDHVIAITRAFQFAVEMEDEEEAIALLLL